MSAPGTGFRFLPASLAESVHELGIRVRRPVRGRGEGLHRSPDFGSSVEFAEYRAYTPGDPLNRIDWSVYARSDRFMVRRFQEETSLRACILLDTSESLDFRDRGSLTKFEYACYLAAGLSYALVRQGDAVRLLTFHDGEPDRELQPATGITGLRPLLSGLETLVPRGRSHIGAALMKAADRLGSRCLVVVISDFLDRPEGIIRGLRRFDHDQHNVLLLHVTDGGERRLSFEGLTELRELESGKRLVVEVDEVRSVYEQALQQHLLALRQGSADCMAEYYVFDTREPVESALHRLRGANS